MYSAVNGFHILIDLSRRKWSPAPSMANSVAIDGPPGPTMAAMMVVSRSQTLVI